MKSPVSPRQRIPVCAGVVAAFLPCLTLLPIEAWDVAAGLLWLAGAILIVFAFCDYAAPSSLHPDRGSADHETHPVRAPE